MVGEAVEVTGRISQFHAESVIVVEAVDISGWISHKKDISSSYMLTVIREAGFHCRGLARIHA